MSNGDSDHTVNTDKLLHQQLLATGGPGGEEQCPDGGSGARTVREPKTPAGVKG